jgi:phosphosulfolactate synthase (CoM biosynthesis protein A)
MSKKPKVPKFERPTELAKVLVLIAKHLPYKYYKRVIAVMGSLIAGLTFGYRSSGINTDFIRDAIDIYGLHKDEDIEGDELRDEIKTKIKRNDNVIPFKVIQGGKEDV